MHSRLKNKRYMTGSICSRTVPDSIHLQQYAANGTLHWKPFNCPNAKSQWLDSSSPYLAGQHCSLRSLNHSVFSKATSQQNAERSLAADPIGRPLLVIGYTTRHKAIALATTK